jgi:uncharacterized membrane protein YjjB (DUF3815 family)
MTSTPDPLTLWALTLIAAALAALTFGLLTYAQTKGNWPAALLAALSAAGATTVGIHQILGH